jgi:PIN domain nuclease of toxin-antitoxin system
MGYLLDTCTLLWAMDAPDRLGKEARRVLETERDVYVSAVSAWEIQIKFSLGKLGLARPPRRWWDAEIGRKGFRALDLEPRAVFLLGGLPEAHKDPFDRMLICQALDRGLVLLTPDPAFQDYPVPVLW